ncbi:hypothetical protein [Streptomyces termitum]
MVVHAPEEEKSAEGCFDATQRLPFAVLQYFVTLGASCPARTGP